MTTIIPPEDGCRILASTYRSGALVLNKIAELTVSLKKLIVLKQSLKFGVASVSTISQSLLGAIATVAAQIAQDRLGDFSKIASRILERIFAALCKILLSYPTGLFSIISIPHEQAINAASEEARCIARARANLRRILSIISRWGGGLSGSSYYDQIQQAFPYVLKAIDACQKMIKDLEAQPGDTGGTRNAVFDESLYNTLKSNLDMAISISTPDSLLIKRAELDKRIEDRKAKIFTKKSAVITAKYIKKNKDLTQWFTEQVKALHKNNKSDTYEQSSDTPSTTSARTKEESKIKATYTALLKSLVDGKKSDLAKAAIEAKDEAEKLMDTMRDAWKIGKEISFSLDIKKLKDELCELVDNIKRAYVKNKECQLYCNNIYNIRWLILNIIKEMIALIRRTGNAGSPMVLGALYSADAFMGVTRGIFENDIEKKASGGISSATLSLDLLIGNTSLVAADSVLDSTITNSLIKLINADDVLEDSDREFEQFMTRLANIRDWDGEYGIWSVKMLQGASSPYIQLIADCSTLLTQVPILCFMKSEGNNDKVRVLVRNVNDTFAKIINHNNEVLNVLNSYSSYQESEVGDLKKILNDMGMLGRFALAMSLTTLITDMIACFAGSFFNEEMTLENCMDSYEELFEDKEIIKYAATSRLSFPAKEFYNETQIDNESKEGDRGTLRLDLKTTKLGVPSDVKASDLLGN